MEGFYYTIATLWNFVYYNEFSFGNVSFTLFDVFVAGLILSLCGYFIGKIVFFIANRR